MTHPGYCFHPGCDCVDYQIQLWMKHHEHDEFSINEAAAFLNGMMAMLRHPEWGQAVVHETLDRNGALTDEHEYGAWMERWDELVKAIPMGSA